MLPTAKLRGVHMGACCWLRLQGGKQHRVSAAMLHECMQLLPVLLLVLLPCCCCWQCIRAAASPVCPPVVQAISYFMNLNGMV
jgi:hypothetical protein